MSINSCTINCESIDAICNDRRQAIIDTLIPPVPSNIIARGHPQHVNPNTDVNLNIFRRDRQHTDPIEESAELLEWPTITVSLDMQGENSAQTLERGDEVFAPLINVWGVELIIPISVTLSDVMLRTESVNIIDIRLRTLK